MSQQVNSLDNKGILIGNGMTPKSIAKPGVGALVQETKDGFNKMIEEFQKRVGAAGANVSQLQ